MVSSEQWAVSGQWPVASGKVVSIEPPHPLSHQILPSITSSHPPNLTPRNAYPQPLTSTNTPQPSTPTPPTTPHHQIGRFFTEDPNVISLVADIAPIAAISYIGLGVFFAAMATLAGQGR